MARKPKAPPETEEPARPGRKSMGSAGRSKLVGVRASDDQRERWKRAAKTTKESVSTFVAKAADERAERVSKAPRSK